MEASRREAAASSRSDRARRPFQVLIKPIGPVCNLDCRYCFYLEKKALYPGRRSFRMSGEVLERFVEAYIGAQPDGTREVNFAWQGGEPTLMGIPFFQRALELQRKHARSAMKVTNALQTNGTLLDDDWGRFLKQHDFLVGISIDGPAVVHDRHRIDRAGAGSFQAVMRGLDALKRHAVEFNTLTVVHADNADDPATLYDFLKEIGSTFLQFIPIVEHAGILEAKKAQRPILPARSAGETAVGARSIRPRRWGAFLNGIFDRWLDSRDVGRIFVQLFDVMLGVLMGRPASLCVHAETCGLGLAIEHNGDLYSCDHYVSAEHKIGNVRDSSLAQMLDGARQQKFGTDKRDGLPRRCHECRTLRFCWGACPKDRISRTPEGEPGLAYLCEGYEAFYRHSLPVFEKMAECLRLGRPACEYQELPRIRARAGRIDGGAGPGRPGVRGGAKIGRNAPCPCGSGEKYKRCCGRAR